MQEYVAGFLFEKYHDLGTNVALIKKKHGPSVMINKLNAIGGKLENDETPIMAMIREFKEETGADVTAWIHYCTLTGPDFKVYFFKAFFNITTDYGIDLNTITDEEVDWYSVERLFKPFSSEIMPNLKWLIPLALDENVELAEVQDRKPND